MDFVQAMRYIVENADSSSEWAEAGAWDLTCRLVNEHKNGTTTWTQQELDILLGHAACN